MTFWKTVGAYLTGWLIANSIYSRVRTVMLEREMENPSESTMRHFAWQANFVAAALDQREETAHEEFMAATASTNGGVSYDDE